MAEKKQEIPKTVFLVEEFPDKTIVSSCPSTEVAGRLADQSVAPHGMITRDLEGKEHIYKW